jgi:hypothetical protein
MKQRTSREGKRSGASLLQTTTQSYCSQTFDLSHYNNNNNKTLTIVSTSNDTLPSSTAISFYDDFFYFP